MNAYYNENDPFAASWLRGLIADGLIANGHVDERDIREVRPADLAGFDQCHFFAGIGGWSYALRLAGWPDSRPIWTGSCPCQPFSAAGKGQGFADTRHLWPAWFRLIRELRPAIVLGEQVTGTAGLGWFDLVSTDLEAESYAVGAADLCAAGLGAPQIRQRLFFVADGGGAGLSPREREELRGAGRGEEGRATPERGAPCGVGDATSDGRERSGLEEHGDEQGAPGLQPDGSSPRRPWDGAIWLPCRDGKARPTQPGLFPLAYGVPNRVGTLRGAGNAIVPQVAAAFIGAVMEARDAE